MSRTFYVVERGASKARQRDPRTHAVWTDDPTHYMCNREPVFDALRRSHAKVPSCRDCLQLIQAEEARLADNHHALKPGTTWQIPLHKLTGGPVERVDVPAELATGELDLDDPAARARYQRMTNNWQSFLQQIMFAEILNGYPAPVIAGMLSAIRKITFVGDDLLLRSADRAAVSALRELKPLLEDMLYIVSGQHRALFFDDLPVDAPVSAAPVVVATPVEEIPMTAASTLSIEEQMLADLEVAEPDSNRQYYPKGRSYQLTQAWCQKHDWLPAGEVLAFFTGSGHNTWWRARQKLSEEGYTFTETPHHYFSVTRPPTPEELELAELERQEQALAERKQALLKKLGR